jgi:uncharacterized protein
MNNNHLPAQEEQLQSVSISKLRAVIEVAGAFLLAQIAYAYIDWKGQKLLNEIEQPTLFQLVSHVGTSVIAIVIIVYILTLSLRKTGTTWGSLGLRKHSAKNHLLNFIVLFIGFNLLGFIGQYISQQVGTPPDISKFDGLRGNLPVLLAAIGSVFVTSGFGEEMIYRGFILERMTNLFSSFKNAPIIAVFTQAFIFGLIHSYQGLSGIIGTGLAGLLFGLVYLKMGRNLTMLIFFHGFVNTLNFTAIYFGVL